MTEPKPKPIHEIRLGRVRAAVWQNTGASGSWPTVTFSRLYLGQENRWQDAASFRKQDLLLLSEVARQAALFLHAGGPAGEEADEMPGEESGPL